MSLTDQERADLEALTSGQVSDAMEALNLRRSVVTGFMMLAPPGLQNRRNGGHAPAGAEKCQ
jgi:hypothetical protein